jgi:hypothetical protein
MAKTPSKVFISDEMYEVASKLVPKDAKDSWLYALVIEVKHKTITDATYFLTAYNTLRDQGAAFPNFKYPVIIQYNGKDTLLRITRNINGLSHLEKLLQEINSCKEFEEIVLKEKSAISE